MRGEQTAVLIEGDAQCAILLPRLVGAGKVFQTVLDPFDRASDQHRGGNYRDVFPPGTRLEAERPAHVLANDSDRGFFPDAKSADERLIEAALSSNFTPSPVCDTARKVSGGVDLRDVEET